MDKSFIPGPLDEALRLEAPITKTATFAGSSYDQGVGFKAGGCGLAAAAVVKTSVIDFSSEDETYKFTLVESADNNTFTACGSQVSVTGVGAISVAGFVTQRYVAVALAAGGTTPSITYEAWLHPNVAANA